MGFYAYPSQAHFDFVVFDPITGQLILAIEVDGEQHRYPEKTIEKLSANDHDNIKDTIMRDICNASLAWLGPIHDGSFSREAYPDGHLESQQCVGEDEFSANPSKHIERATSITVSDWRCTPNDLRGNSFFVFLRIPSDGSTYWETDALASSVNIPPGSSSIPSPPTIEDYIRYQLSFNKDRESSRVFVSEKIRQGEGSISISECLKKWEQKPALKQKLETVDPQIMNRCLLRAGYHCLVDDTRKPTEKGRKVGIKSKPGKNKEGTYAFPVYTQAAQSHILQNLDSILGYRDD